MIITDGTHLVSTTSEDELHKFAQRMGLKREWYQNHPIHPHYDLTTQSALERAIDKGAQMVLPSVLLKQAWWTTWELLSGTEELNEPDMTRRAQ